MTKVAIVASYPDSIVHFRGALIDDLIARGATVYVAAPDLTAESRWCKALEERGAAAHQISLRRTGINPVSDARAIIQLGRFFLKIRPDVLLSYTIKPVIYGTIIGWMVGVPRRFALVTGVGYLFTSDRKGVLSSLVRRLYHFAIGKADKVFFQNPDDKLLFEDVGILSHTSNAVVVNGSGVDVDAFTEKPLPPGDIVFLMIARLLGDKGVREYAEAAATVRAACPNARFHLAGWIDEHPDAISRQELESWVEEGGIEFLGYLDDVRPTIEASTVYVLPSYREGTPRTVLEAMAMGRPIITTDAPGCRETVVDGENGLLVPVKSVDGLVEAMQRFIDNPALAVEMGRQSREIAEEKYDVRKVNAVMLREMGIT
jgi:glycosyltransferase involved in cell wall biosynthesis